MAGAAANALPLAGRGALRICRGGSLPSSCSTGHPSGDDACTWPTPTFFLEILLAQDNRDQCRAFLEGNWQETFISDFSLHSIGVILFRTDRADLFGRFCDEMPPSLEILSLPKTAYDTLPGVRANHGLDFDDAYQYGVAREFGLVIVTQDTDFKAVEHQVSIRLID